MCLSPHPCLFPSLSLSYISIFFCVSLVPRDVLFLAVKHTSSYFSRQGPKNNKKWQHPTTNLPVPKTRKENSWNIFLEQFCSLFPPRGWRQTISRVVAIPFLSCCCFSCAWCGKSGIGLTTLTIIKKTQTKFTKHLFFCVSIVTDNYNRPSFILWFINDITLSQEASSSSFLTLDVVAVRRAENFVQCG